MTVGYDAPLPSLGTVASLWRERVSKDAAGSLLRIGSAEFTAAEIDERASALGTAVALSGLSRADVVGQFSATCVEVVSEYLGCSLYGVPVAPVNTSFRGQMLAYILNDCGCRLLFCDREQVEKLDHVQGIVPRLERIVVHGVSDEDVAAMRGQFAAIDLESYEGFTARRAEQVSPPDIGPRDINCIMYTSGTTGPSKGVLISNLLAVNKALDFDRICQIDASDTLYSPLPLFHETGLFKAFLGSVAAGARVLLREKFSASQFWPDVRSAGVTVGVGFPAMQTWLLEAGPSPTDRQHTLRRLLSLPNPEFAERFGVWPVASYGTTEITSAFHIRPDEPLRPGTCGRPSRDWQVRLVDDDGNDVPDGTIGEILLRPLAPGRIMSGYLNKPEATQAALEDLWYHPGDLAMRDPDGFYYFKGRKKDVIRRRGENISAWELERILQMHPGIDTAVALPRHRQDGDDDVWVVIVPSAAASPTAAEVLSYCERELPDFMVPRYIELRASLPRTAATARVQKHVLAGEGPGPSCFDAGDRRRPRAVRALAKTDQPTTKASMTQSQLSFSELLDKFPGYLIDYDNEAHYRAMLERRLVLPRCGACGYWIYPISPLCPSCWSDEVIPAEVSGQGTIHLFTLLHQGAPIPGVDFSTPHPIAGVELAERPGLRYLAPLVNCPNEQIRIGMPVELTWIERDGRPAPAFQPASNGEGKI